MAILDCERSIRVVVGVVCALVIQLACLARAHADNTKAWALPLEPDVAQSSQWKAAVPGAQQYGAALDNGLVLVVARPGSEGVELYVKGTNWVRRALLVVSGRDTDPVSSIEKVAVVRTDKGPTALKLTMGFVDARITLGAGGPYVSVQPGESAHWFELRADAAYALMPDFFADDVIFDPRKHAASSFTIPADNFLLHFAQNGRTILMCIWPGTLTGPENKTKEAAGDVTPVEEPQVVLRFTGTGEARRIQGTRIEFQGKPVHVGVLEQEGIWHDVDVSAWTAYKPREPDWKRPFEAKWRADYIVAQDKSMSNWRTRQQSFNFMNSSSKDTKPPQVWQESLKDRFSFPAYFKETTAFLCPYADKSKRRKARELTEKARASDKNAPAVPPENVYERVIIYPLDRINRTPLTMWTPVDLMRNTLGQDPCAYVLDLEGLKARGSGGERKLLAGNSCALWSQHISPIADKIKKLDPDVALDDKTKTHLIQALEDIWVFIHIVADRIREYQAWTAETTEFTSAAAARSGKAKPVADRVLGHLNTFNTEMSRIKFEGMAVLGWGKPQGTEGYWKVRLDEIITQVKQDDYSGVQSVGTICKLGGYQDGKVSRCRQYVKGIRQEALLADAGDPEVRKFVTEIRERCGRILRRKHRKEGL